VQQQDEQSSNETWTIFLCPEPGDLSFSRRLTAGEREGTTRSEGDGGRGRQQQRRQLTRLFPLTNI